MSEQIGPKLFRNPLLFQRVAEEVADLVRRETRLHESRPELVVETIS